MTKPAAPLLAAPVGPRLEFKRSVCADEGRALIDFVATHVTLSRQQIKDAANKGAIVLRRGGKVRRVRRVQTQLQPGDRIELHYDAQLLGLQPPQARCVADRDRYSLWLKPPGMLAQGNEFGDHCALTRVVEVSRQPPRPVWLVHRLDREALGLMLLAHERRAAADLSRQFQLHQVQKDYRVQVHGDLAASLGAAGVFEQALDGKPARTEYRVIEWDARANRTTLAVRIHSGRLHQIRRHFDAAGFPVMGDPRYGRDNACAEGLRLAAVGLAFQCPVDHCRVDFQLDAADIGF